MDRYIDRLLTWLLISIRHSPSVKITVDDMSCLKETAQFTAALRCCCDNVMTDDNDMIIW